MKQKLLSTMMTGMLSLIAILCISACSGNGADEVSTVDPRSFDTCVEEINYTVSIGTFRHFFPEGEELTLREKVVSLPKVEHLDVKICTSQDGHYKIETSALPELAPQVTYPENALGIPDMPKWKSINTDGVIITYDEKGQVISNKVSALSLTADQVSKIAFYKAAPLQNVTDFGLIMEEIKKQTPMTMLPNGDYMITTTGNGKKVETIISKEFQREVSQTIYATGENIESIRTYKYKIVNDKTILQTETFNTYMPSFDSDKTLVISKVMDYTFN